jgi:aryl-alcohol dehydrogenase-like predicted oxidoreductase
MDYRTLGRTGVQVSPLCLGTMNFGGPTAETDAIEMIHKAIDSGINFLDCANVYQDGESERVLGKALEGEYRKQVILATKVHFPTSDDPNDRGNSRRHIFQAVEDSLRRLRTDWIDLYQIHRPVFGVAQEETLHALDDLVRQGKVRYIGCSTFPAWMVLEALSISERDRITRYVTEQPPYNLLDRRIENELVPLALKYELALLPWSPLAMGILAGRYKSIDGYPEGSRIDRIGSWAADRLTRSALVISEKVAQLAQENDLTSSQLALLWTKDQPGVTSPIIGPRTLDHLDDALSTLELTLSSDLAQAIDDLVPPGSAVADFHNTSGWMKMKL